MPVATRPCGGGASKQGEKRGQAQDRNEAEWGNNRCRTEATGAAENGVEEGRSNGGLGRGKGDRASPWQLCTRVHNWVGGRSGSEHFLQDEECMTNGRGS